MAYKGDVASTVFKDPTRIKQLVAAGYRVLLMGAHLDRFATSPIAVMQFGQGLSIPGPKKLYFVFAPPAVATGSWDRHVDVYLNDIMNTPAPKYEQENTSDSTWLPMKVDFADQWEGVMLNHTHLSETHEGIRLGADITDRVTVTGPFRGGWGAKSRYCYGMMDENGVLNGPVTPNLVGMVTASATQATAVPDRVIMLSEEHKDNFSKRSLIVHI